MNTKPSRHVEEGRFPFTASSNYLPATIIALVMLCQLSALAQVPPRFYWQSLSGANAVPVIFESLSGNANPIDPAHFL